MTELRIEPVSWDHPDACRLRDAANRFYVTLYGGPDATPVSAGEFAAPVGGFFVGYLGDRPVGTAGWRFYAGRVGDAVRPAEIKRMFVDESVRGHGLGRRLLRAIEADAATSGADSMILETGRPQVAAISLYRACGYTDIPAFGHYAAEPSVVNLGKPLIG